MDDLDVLNMSAPGSTAPLVDKRPPAGYTNTVAEGRACTPFPFFHDVRNRWRRTSPLPNIRRADKVNMAELGFELEEITQLIRLVESRGLMELVVEEAGCCIVIRGANYARSRRSPLAEPTLDETGAPIVLPEAPLATAPAERARAEEFLVVRAPMTGVFYRAASPDSPPFVEVGDYVEVGQTIGIIEAMKVFSEIPSEFSGVVAEMVANNNQLVREHEPLLYLHPQ